MNGVSFDSAEANKIFRDTSNIEYQSEDSHVFKISSTIAATFTSSSVTLLKPTELDPSSLYDITNGFFSFGSFGAKPLRYFKDADGIVYIQGNIQSPNSGSNLLILTMPSGYTVSGGSIQQGSFNATAGTFIAIGIETNGDIRYVPSYTANDLICLNISYLSS